MPVQWPQSLLIILLFFVTLQIAVIITVKAYPAVGILHLAHILTDIFFPINFPTSIYIFISTSILSLKIQRVKLLSR